MLPQFSSSELNQLLALELAKGLYQSPEDALLAGLKLLRETRDNHSRITDRIVSLSSGQTTLLKDDEALANFLDAIDAEVDAEIQARS